MKYSIKAFIRKEGDAYVAECIEVDAVVMARTLDETVNALRNRVCERLHGADNSSFGLVDDPTLFIVFEDVPIPSRPLACSPSFGACQEGRA